MRELTKTERAFLYNHYEQAMNTPLGSALTGTHWLLIATLNKLGFSANSIEEAYALSEQLLWPSYHANHTQEES